MLVPPLPLQVDRLLQASRFAAGGLQEEEDEDEEEEEEEEEEEKEEGMRSWRRRRIG